MKKRGFQLMSGTFLIIVSGALILIFLAIILEFQTGYFSILLRKISHETNLDSAISICNSLSSREAQQNYCCTKLQVSYNDNGLKTEEFTYEQLEASSLGNEKINPLSCKEIICK